MANVVTVTLNPAIDASTTVRRVRPDRKLRCARPQREPGGGGINVAEAARRLGGDVRAWWASGGPNGDRLGHLLDDLGLPHRPFPIQEETRENLSVFEEDAGQQFRFTMPGGAVTEEEAARLLEETAALDPAPPFLVLSGSLPPGLEANFYARLADAAPPETRVIVDTSGPALQCAIEAGVYLLKPNLGELASIVDDPLDDDARIAEAVQQVIEAGSVEVLVVSIGAGGVILGTREGIEHIRAPTVPIRSRVGAGDSTVAGIVVALVRGASIQDAVRYGVAAGSAAVMTPGTELCRREDVERLYAHLKEK